MPNVEMFRMLGSGTEAVMASLRIAALPRGKSASLRSAVPIMAGPTKWSTV